MFNFNQNKRCLSCIVYEIHRWELFVKSHLPRLYLALLLGVTRFEFQYDNWRQKTGVPALSCGVVWAYAILNLAVLVGHWLLTDEQHGSRGDNRFFSFARMWVMTTACRLLSKVDAKMWIDLGLSTAACFKYWVMAVAVGFHCDVIT